MLLWQLCSSYSFPPSYQENEQHEEAVRDLERVVQLERTYDNQAAVKEGKRYWQYVCVYVCHVLLIQDA